MNFPTYEDAAKVKQLKKRATFIVLCLLAVSLAVGISILPSFIG